MAKFSSTNQPPRGRGKAERTKILEAMQRENKTEEEFYQALVKRAFDPLDNFGYKEVLQRISPIRKAVMPDIEFFLDPDASPQDKASQILEAVSTAQIPPDVGISLINAIRNVLDIEINTEVKARIEEIESKLGIA